MPEKYLLELICDSIGAGKAYLGSSWNNNSPIDYYNKRDYKSFYHDETRKAIVKVYEYIRDNRWKNWTKLVRTRRWKFYD